MSYFSFSLDEFFRLLRHNLHNELSMNTVTYVPMNKILEILT